MDHPRPNAHSSKAPWIGGGFRPWPRPTTGQVTGASGAATEPVEAFLEVLDPPVRPLVAALNRTGWVLTVFSCGGHPEEPDAHQWGRRQAHLDVLVREADRDRWQRFVDRCQQSAPAAVSCMRAGAGLRCVEGSLGDVPPWLSAMLEQDVPDEFPRSGVTTGVDRTLRSRVRWQYRRLVFEPVPYGIPPERCRRVLDRALAAALAALHEGGQEDPTRSTS
jgi:hypothetical protein